MKRIGFLLIAIGFILGFSVIPYTPSDNGFILSGGVARASGGGPMVLDGMDPVCHAAMGENTDQYIAKVVKSVYDQSSMPGNNGKIAILGVPNLNMAGGCGGNHSLELQLLGFNQQLSSSALILNSIHFLPPD